MTEFITAGTYEGGLLGMKLNFVDGEIEMKTEFAFSAHLGAIKSLASQQMMLATGSADETIQIYDLTTKKHVGVLNGHEGTINALDFFGKKHMVSGGEDGKLNIWRCTDWEMLTELKGHKDSIIDVKFHPSGRMCLSVSKDLTVRLWDLMRATCPVSAKLKELPLQVQWSPSGSSYAILFNNKLRVVRVGTNCAVDVQAVALDAEAAAADRRPRLTCAYVVSENVVMLGTDCGDVQLLVLEGPEEAQKARLLAVMRPAATEKRNRVKALAVVRALSTGFEFASFETEGHIRVYAVPLKELLDDESGQPDLLEPALQHGAELRLIAGVSSFDRRKLTVLFPSERVAFEGFVKEDKNDEEEDAPIKRAAAPEAPKQKAKKAKQQKRVAEPEGQLLESEDEAPAPFVEEEEDLPIQEVKRGAPAPKKAAPAGSSRAALASLNDDEDDFEAIRKLKAASQLHKSTHGAKGKKPAQNQKAPSKPQPKKAGKK